MYCGRSWNSGQGVGKTIGHTDVLAVIRIHGLQVPLSKANNGEIATHQRLWERVIERYQVILL
ncbi:hypothetical protein [Gynuella sunshinyii]|uniref:Uncharacterized protein n=1 Tax=Gynuella sunshinyii YC6258 TaxID=1445510 RepID=A0A0C5VIY3_9GAMM|nr:hypothetical protein [Gynuella sunshinyii]AJQ93323.1 hypothetical Protein YC6258_01275 [Gynuella sunshinyii YC6258]